MLFSQITVFCCRSFSERNSRHVDFFCHMLSFQEVFQFSNHRFLIHCLGMFCIAADLKDSFLADAVSQLLLSTISVAAYSAKAHLSINLSTSDSVIS